MIAYLNFELYTCDVYTLCFLTPLAYIEIDHTVSSFSPIHLPFAIVLWILYDRNIGRIVLWRCQRSLIMTFDFQSITLE